MDDRSSGNAGLSESVAEAYQNLIDVYVNTLKEAYTRRRRKIRPDYRGPGLLHHEKWEAVARVLIDEKLDPYAYVQFVFTVMSERGSDVYDNMVTSINLANAFKKERPERMEGVRQSVLLQAKKVQTMLRNGYTVEEVLKDPYSELTPVFRFALATSERRHDIAETLREAAERMILFEPLYKELLGKWLPEEMLV